MAGIVFSKERHFGVFLFLFALSVACSYTIISKMYSFIFKTNLQRKEAFLEGKFEHMAIALTLHTTVRT